MTIRYHDPRPFKTFPSRAARSPYGVATAQDILFGLLDATIDRLADILELTDGRIEAVSRELFDNASQVDSAALRRAVAALGQAGTLVSDVRNSLVTVERAITFLDRDREGSPQNKRMHRSLKVLSTDATSLSEHANFLTQKLGLILDAAFNLTSIRQNSDRRGVLAGRCAVPAADADRVDLRHELRLDARGWNGIWASGRRWGRWRCPRSRPSCCSSGGACCEHGDCYRGRRWRRGLTLGRSSSWRASPRRSRCTTRAAR